MQTIGPLQLKKQGILLIIHQLKGAILQSSIGAYGHVAYVESVDSNGSVTVSEMNYNGGPYVVDTRTIPSNEASSYNYIHMD